MTKPTSPEPAPPAPPDVGGSRQVTSYADVDALLRSDCLKDPLKAADGPYTRSIMHMRGSLVFMDPPEHTRLRALVTKAFTARTIEALRPRIQHLVDTLLAPLLGAERFELVSAFSRPLPAMVIAEMIGVDPGDRSYFHAWSADIAHGFSPDVAPEVRERVVRSWDAFCAYFGRVIAERRATPRDDLITRLIAARVGDDLLTDAEMVGLLVEIVDAGTLTTTDLIGNAMFALLRAPAQLQKLRDAPSLIPNAVDEVLRLDPSIQWTERIAIDGVMVAGCPISAGEWIWPSLSSANRDPAVFPDPDRFDVTRPNADHHLAFGGGRHFCPGAALARLEAQIAIATLLRSFPTLRLDGDDDPPRKTAPGFSGFQVLPLRT
jgi:cytochrome P450